MSSTTIVRNVLRGSASVLVAAMSLGLAVPASAGVPAHPVISSASISTLGPGASGLPYGPDGQWLVVDTAATKVQDRLGEAFSRWMDQNNVPNGSMAVMRDNGLVGEFDKGDHSGAEMAVPVASLSKAITGVCVMSLIDNGTLRFDTTLSEMSEDFKNSTGVSSHLARVGDITIEQLLRHRSGIISDPVAVGRLVGVPLDGSADLTLIKQALRPKPAGRDRSQERYNNINYAILGRVIQSVTGESYESYCKRMVLAPRGAPNAHLGAGVRAMGAFGGWEISPVEYAMFARAFDPRSRLLSPRAHSFITAMMNKDGATASLGMFVRQTSSGYNLFHFGNWSSTATTPQQFGSYFAMWDNGIAVTVTFDREISDEAAQALDRALAGAAYDPR